MRAAALTLTGATTSGDYRALTQQVRDAGLLQRRPWYYRVKIAATLGALVACVAALYLVGDSPATLVVAAVLAIVFTQVVFVGHDAGHLQVFNSRRANRALGLIAGNLLTGLSFGWWVPKHNAHHGHPNQVGRDPDIGAGVIAFTDEIARTRRGAGRLFARCQAWLFFPLLLLEGLGMHLASVRALLERRDWGARLEVGLLAIHAVCYLAIVFWVLSLWWAIAFVAVHQAIFGLYLGCSFAPNHKGMLIVETDSPMGFAGRQILTSRNMSGGWFTTFVFGGLNYQVEHHLFPTMPRPNLPSAQVFVRSFCVEHDLTYCESTVLGSYRQALTHLSRVGAAGRAV